MSPREHTEELHVAPAKLSAEEMRVYYRRLHHEAQQSHAGDLRAIVDPGATDALNRFHDYAHRLGMKKAFRFLGRGGIAGKHVLDAGCGCGRWVRAYAARNAVVTGVDVSQDAVANLQDKFPKHTFVCQDLAALSLPPESFDIANSVTVLQHLPPDAQSEALRRIVATVRPGGYLVLLENIADFDAPEVFPHSSGEWIKLVEGMGMELCFQCGSNYSLLLRAARWMRRWAAGQKVVDKSDVMDRAPRPPSKAALVWQPLIAFASYPVEWMCSTAPFLRPTHAVMIFQKTFQKPKQQC